MYITFMHNNDYYQTKPVLKQLLSDRQQLFQTIIKNTKIEVLSTRSSTVDNRFLVSSLIYVM